MAWVELVPFGAILLLVGWIFLRPYPGDPEDKQRHDSDSDGPEPKEKD